MIWLKEGGMLFFGLLLCLWAAGFLRALWRSHIGGK